MIIRVRIVGFDSTAGACRAGVVRVLATAAALCPDAEDSVLVAAGLVAAEAAAFLRPPSAAGFAVVLLPGAFLAVTVLLAGLATGFFGAVFLAAAGLAGAFGATFLVATGFVAALVAAFAAGVFFAGALPAVDLVVFVAAVFFAAGVFFVTLFFAVPCFAAIFFATVFCFGVAAAAVFFFAAAFGGAALAAGAFFLLEGAVFFVEVFFAALATSGTSTVRHEISLPQRVFSTLSSRPVREPGRNINHFPRPAQCRARPVARP